MQSFGLTDAPVTKLNENTLGTIDYVQALADFIQNCQTPMTISIQGDWGSGKTSMMMMIKDKLENPKGKIETIWFNTWQFSQFQMQDQISTSLLSSFLDELQECGEKAKRTVFKAAFSGAKLFTKAFADIAIGGGGDAIEKLFEKFDSSNLDSCKAIKNLRKEIEEAIQGKLAKTKSERLVVFIDDLDRLMPEKAVEILEVLKLFLDIPNCIFLLAVDYQVVAKGLEKKFGVGMADLKGKSFFDKIIQLPFNLPVAQYDTRKYFESLFSSGFHYNQDHFEAYTNLTATSLGFNPRGMKRLFNALKLLNMVAESRHIMDENSNATPAEKQRILFAILCLQTAYEPAYRLILKNLNSLSDLLLMMSDMEKLKQSSHFTELQGILGDTGGDKLMKFCKFIHHFTDAIQIESDGTAEISEAEIENLKSLISFSSLTSSDSTMVDLADAQGFRYKSQIARFIETHLNPKLSAYLDSIKSKFETDFEDRKGCIFFLFSLGGIEFKFRAEISDFTEITVHLDDNGLSGSKDFTEAWFKADFPKQEVNKKKTYAYQVLVRHKFLAGTMSESDAQKMSLFYQLSEKTFHLIIPKLCAFHGDKQPVVRSIFLFQEKLEVRLRDAFPESEGWLLSKSKSNMLVSEARYIINHQLWNTKFSYEVVAYSQFFSNIAIGIKKSGNVSIDPGVESSIQNDFAALFSGIEPAKTYIALKSFPEAYRNTLSGRLMDAGSKYAYPTKESEEMALSHIINSMVQLKQFSHRLESAARESSQ